MRILFTFIGGQGHFWPLVPVARAAQRAGREVAVAGAGNLVATIEGAGFTAYRTSEPTPPAQRRPVALSHEPLEVTDKEAAEVEFATNFAGKGARRHADVVPGIIEQFAPDVLVRDEAAFGSAVAAERCGVPSASLLVLADGSLVRRDLVGPHLAELRAAHGLRPDPGLAMIEQDLVLSPFPPSLRHPDHALPADAVAYRAQASPPARRGTPSRPHVYFTLGTVFNAESGDLFTRTLAGLAAVDADVTVTVGSRLDPASFGPQPEHVRIERFVPQAELLPTCDLVVSHGGSGSLMGALTHGLPSVLLPLGADQPHNAERAEALGVARALDAARATPAEITHAVEEVLATSSYRERASAIRAEIEALPGVEAAVAGLERLAPSG